MTTKKETLKHIDEFAKENGLTSVQVRLGEKMSQDYRHQMKMILKFGGTNEEKINALIQLIDEILREGEK